MKDKNLLVVVDFQNDFVNGSLGFNEAKSIEKNILEKIEAYEKNGDDIIFTLDTHFENYLETVEGENLPVEHCIKGSDGWKIYGKLEEISKKYRKIEKNTFGSFELAEFIKNSPNSYKNIELAGLVSNICIISNAVIAKAASPESNIIVDANATSSYDFDMQKKAFEVMKNLHIKIENYDFS